MKTFEIATHSDGITDSSIIECGREGALSTLRLRSNPNKTYKSHDLFECLGLLRADFPERNFYAKVRKSTFTLREYHRKCPQD
jgi:hypothetical protein